MTPRPPLLPAEFARHTVEALHAEHGARRSWTLWLLLLGLSGALASLPFIRIDITVRAAGVVRPTTERVELRTAAGGRVTRVMARDNDRVAAGQLLMEIASRDLDERLMRNRAMQRERSALSSDLAALVDAEAADGTGGLQTPLLQREHAEFLARIGACRLVAAKAESDFERVAGLCARGILAAREQEDARFCLERAKADGVLIEQQTIAGWQARLRAEETALADLRSEENRLVEEIGLGAIRAPAAGTVQGLTGLTAGAYVLPGQSLGCVSPDDRPLVEALVSPRDIALIRPGQEVRLQVHAYPYTRWGLLPGTVESVAGDASAFDGQAGFKVVIRPLRLELRLRDGPSGALRKGMTATARFVVGRRSLFQLLREEAGDHLDPQSVAPSA